VQESFPEAPVAPRRAPTETVDVNLVNHVAVGRRAPASTPVDPYLNTAQGATSVSDFLKNAQPTH